MLPGSHALQVLTPKDIIEVRHGSCVRHRFSRADCRQCFDICPAKALDWGEDGLHWDASRCQGCLLCTSSCPSGALQGSEISFVSLLQDLTEIDQPVLACSKMPQTSGHARLPCLGILANPELLLVLQLTLGRQLTLNLSACADCQNQAILQPLESSLQRVQQLAVGFPGAVVSMAEEEQLQFQEFSCSRREFFGRLRSRTKRAGISIAERLQATSDTEAYGKKQLPAARQLLLQVFDYLPETRQEISARLFPQVEFSGACRACTGCIGICPTGALLPPVEGGGPPVFQADFCTGCRVCEQFCSRSGLRVSFSD